MPVVNRGTGPRRVAGALLAALLGLTGVAACGGDDEPDDPPVTSPSGAGAPSTPASPAPAASPTASAELLQFEIARGRATPPLDRIEIEQGSTVRIVVTSDQPDAIHLHGYDLEAPIGPGADGVIEFTADQAGLFELETHDTGLVLAQLQVR